MDTFFAAELVTGAVMLLITMAEVSMMDRNFVGRNFFIFIDFSFLCCNVIDTILKLRTSTIRLCP